MKEANVAKPLSKSILFYVLILGFFFFGVCLSQASDTTELEGTWKDLHQGWAFEFSGNKVKITAPSPQMCMEGTFTSDPEADPKKIDIKIEKAGAPQYQGHTSLGIYKIDDVLLTLALAEPGNNNRPQEFSSASGAMVIRVTKIE
jgi:uncharacterized protein (TIGR03067 family)